MFQSFSHIRLKCLLKNQKIIDDELEKKFDGVTWFASHAPLLNDQVIEKLSSFDIASFGHTHGGIVPLGLDELFDKLNWHFGLISANHKPFPRNVRGVKAISDSTFLAVNPGMVGTHFCVSRPLQNMNFVKAAEVSVIELVGKATTKKASQRRNRASCEDGIL